MTDYSTVSPDPVPHFEITDALLKAMTFDDSRASIHNLMDYYGTDVAPLPYPELTIRVNVLTFTSLAGWNAGAKNSSHKFDGTLSMTVRLRGACTRSLKDDGARPLGIEFHSIAFMETSEWTARYDLNTGLLVYDTGQSSEDVVVLKPYFRGITTSIGVLLTAALATSNVHKHTSINKRAGRGYASGHFRGRDGVIRLSRTILDIPAPEPGEPTGKRQPFHLRRGHKHGFRTGKNHEGPLIYKFIPAMLINSELRPPGAPDPAPKYEVT